MPVKYFKNLKLSKNIRFYKPRGRTYPYILNIIYSKRKVAAVQVYEGMG
jgi:hypothetical protein